MREGERGRKREIEGDKGREVREALLYQKKVIYFASCDDDR